MAKKRKAPAPLDLYALDPAAKRSIEVEARRAKEIMGGPRFAARPKSTGSLSRPRRGGIERTADRLYEAGLPLSVTDAIKSVDRNLLGLDDTAQSLRNVMNDEAGAGDYVNLALSSPVGALALKPLELGARGIGRAAMRGGRRALNTRAGRFMTEARPLVDEDTMAAAFSARPVTQRRITDQRPVVRGLPAPFSVPVAPADKTAERVMPTLNVSDRGSQMRDYARYTEMVPISWLEQLEGNELRYGGDRLRALSEDIATRGIANPLILSVGKENSSAILGEGNHRLAAARMAGMTHLPARVAVGDEVGGLFAGRSDLVPVSGKYFPSQAKPSDVFTSLQEGADPNLSRLVVRKPEPLSPELQALLDEFNAEQLLRELEMKKARGGLAVKRNKR